MQRKNPSFPELATTTLPELFDDVFGSIRVVTPNSTPWATVALREIALRWHDPNCECKFTVTEGGQLVEKAPCMRCSNVRRAILERL